MNEHKSSVFTFADVEVREREFCIARDGEVLAVEPKAFRVLLFLLRNPHKLITKEELLDAVWGDVAVSENSLTRSIALLRKVLGDDTHEPRFIATVPTVGYRFSCDVKVAEDGVARHPPPEADIPARAEEEQRSTDDKRPATLLLAGICVLAIGVPAAIVLIHHSVGKHQGPGIHVTEQRVTSNSPEAPVEFAVVSPDGKYVAYSDPTGLYLRVIASGETRRWDVPKDFVANPNGWFPDGTHLLVTRFEGPSRVPSLWKLSMLGGDPRKLIDNAGRGSLSPDGTRIAYESVVPSWGHELWVMGADGSNRHRITESRVWVLGVQRPSFFGGSIYFPAWSPNSQRIASIERHLISDPHPGGAVVSSLWTRNADGSDPQMIVKDSWLGTGVAWTPDGRILFASRVNTVGERQDQGVRAVRVDERTGKAIEAPQFVTDGSGLIGGISITSDGKRLVLWRANTQLQAFVSEFDAQTRKWKTPQRLTLDANGNMATAWLPDSRTVLFVSNRNGVWTLFKQAIDETTAEALVEEAPVEGHFLTLPRLSADGSQVLYQSRTDPANSSAPRSLMRLPVEGGSPQLVLKDVGIWNHQCARLPSTMCIFSKVQGGDTIYFSFDPEHGLGRELLRSSDIGDNWTLSPDGKTLAVLPGDHRIRFFSVENGIVREENTVTLNDWRLMNGDWNANGTGVLINSITPAGTPVILEADRAGKATVALEGAANTRFSFMISAPNGHFGILTVDVPSDNNAWMVDNF